MPTVRTVELAEGADRSRRLLRQGIRQVPPELHLSLAAGLAVSAAALLFMPLHAVAAMAATWMAVVAGAALAAARWGAGRSLGAADGITLLRAFASCVLAAAIVAAPELSPKLLWTVTGLASAALLLDGADGMVARRGGRASEFGARLDQEVDAFTILLLSMLVWRLDRAGAWVIAAGGMRYAFFVAGCVFSRLRAPLPPNRRRQAVCVFQVGVLIVCIPPFLPASLQWYLPAVALAALGWSFARDVRWLWEAGKKGPAVNAGPSAGSAGVPMSGPV